MKKRYFKDWYGCTASIRINRDLSASLSIADSTGKHIFGKCYGTEHGARVALSKWSDTWKEVKQDER